MTTIAFDTSTPLTVAAVSVNGGILERSLEAPPGGHPAHCAQLVGALDSLLAGAGSGWDEVERIGVGAGPGTFTGIRVASSGQLLDGRFGGTLSLVMLQPFFDAMLFGCFSGAFESIFVAEEFRDGRTDGCLGLRGGASDTLQRGSQLVGHLVDIDGTHTFKCLANVCSRCHLGH